MDQLDAAQGPKAQPKTKATKQAKASEQVEAAEANPLDPAANQLVELGFSERIARQDAPVLDLLFEHGGGPLREDGLRGQLAERAHEISSWTLRRLADGRHGKLTFEPLIAREGRGRDRVGEVVGA